MSGTSISLCYMGYSDLDKLVIDDDRLHIQTNGCLCCWRGIFTLASGTATLTAIAGCYDVRLEYTQHLAEQ